MYENKSKFKNQKTMTKNKGKNCYKEQKVLVLTRKNTEITTVC